MRHLCCTCVSPIVAVLAIGLHSPSFAADTDSQAQWMPPNTFSAAEATEPVLRFSWMLPRTVIDITIVYAFEGCADSDKGAELRIKITPTLVPRAIPDTSIGRLGINPNDLVSFWNDKSVSLQTFAGSHILNSIGSAPASQVGQIAANILGGITKLAAVGLGVAAAAPAAIPPSAAVSKCGTAKNTKAEIDNFKSKIRSLQAEIANGVDEATFKKDTGEIEGMQNLISSVQADLTLSIKKTIDPGVSPIEINSDAETSRPPRDIEITGRVASFDLSDKQLAKLNWYKELRDVSQAERSLLQVNVYLDFDHADAPISSSRRQVSPNDNRSRLHLSICCIHPRPRMVGN